jgi:hypothetical protein
MASLDDVLAVDREARRAAVAARRTGKRIGAAAE